MPKLLVTGASGFLGGEVARRAADGGWAVTGTFHRRPIGLAGSARLDVRDPDAVDALFARVRPDAVVHTAYVRTGAALDATIVAGTAHVARAARRQGSRLVHMSTDLVFGGRAEPYVTDDEPEPVDDYGRAKAAAECAVLEYERAVVVRTSLLYSIARPCPAVEMVLAGSGRFFVDEYRCPTLVEDLATGLLRLAGSETAGVVHVNAAEMVSRFDFACLVAAYFGRTETVLAGTVADHPAPRPARVALVPSVPGCRDVSEVLRLRSS